MGNLIIDEIIPLHSEVAGRIKDYENVQNEAPPLEVINELRYALRAVLELERLQSADEPNQEGIDHANERAKHALLCAYHDLVDGIAIDLKNALVELVDRYPKATIQVLGEKRIEILEYLEDVNDVIRKSRENTQSRNDMYKKELYEEKRFDKLLEYRKYLFRTAYPEIVKADQIIQNDVRRQRMQTIAAIGATVVIGSIGIWAAL